MHRGKNLLIAVWVTVLGIGLHAQGERPAYDPDVVLRYAQALAFSGQTGPARDTLVAVLSDYPEYADVETLLAKTYSWEGDYDQARRHLNRVTSRERQHAESWRAAIRNEQYAGNRSLALGLANKALTYLGPDSAIAGIRREILDSATTLPTREEAENWQNSLSLENQVQVFDNSFAPMVYAQLQYERKTKLGKIIPRLNYSNRFNIHGVQYELDLYPKISNTFYAYLNYGYSAAPTYPAHRAGVELFANLPSAMEVSLGVRHLDFRETTAHLLTGSFGLYRGNYYLNFRPFVSVFRDREPGFSGSLQARRYLDHALHYLGLRAVYGFNPELQQLRSGGQLLAESLFFVESQEVQLEYQFTGSSRRNRYRAQIGLMRQELVLEPGSFFLAFQAGLRYQAGF